MLSYVTLFANLTHDSGHVIYLVMHATHKCEIPSGATVKGEGSIGGIAGEGRFVSIPEFHS